MPGTGVQEDSPWPGSAPTGETARQGEGQQADAVEGGAVNFTLGKEGCGWIRRGYGAIVGQQEVQQEDVQFQ